MTDKTSKHTPGDDLDILLDAGLAKYVAGEPRGGLEDRIFANLRAEQQLPAVHPWWKWGLAAIAVIVVVAVTLVFRSEKRSQPVSVKQTPDTTKSISNRETKIANREGITTPKRPAPRPMHAHPNAPVLEGTSTPTPKLDQFPSPQPLTEEEKMLLGYIEHNPEHAALMAEARMDSLRQDEEERHKLEAKGQ